MLHVSLLGFFCITEDTRVLRLTLPRKGVALLAYLLLHRPGRVYRDALAATLWPDVTDGEARGKLRRLLYVVSSGLGEARAQRWLCVDSTTLGWNPEMPTDVDVQVLRAAVRDERWDEAVAIYRGDLLTGFEDEWVVEERDRLREQHLIDLERLGRRRRSERRHADAISVIAELLRLDPWREDALRTSLELRVATGDRAGALGEYDRFVTRLREDLDVEPMAETTALYDDIVAGRSFAPVEPPLATRARRPFAGRDVQLARLRECCSRAERGRGNLVFIGGESGVGKSRLLEEFAVQSGEGGTLVLCGETSFIESMPFQAIVNALRPVAANLGGLGVDGTWLAVLEGVMPGATGEYRPSRAGLDPESERRRLFEAVAVALEALAAASPVLLLLEDLHAAGSATIALLEYVARRVATARVTIVATYRDGDVPLAHPLRALRRRLQRDGTATSLALGPLEARDVEALLAASFEGVGPDVARRYFELTEGLPLYLNELVTDAVKSGSALPELPSQEMPSGLAATLERRLGDVPEPARAVLSLAAVIGTRFDVELIVAASGWSEAASLEQLGTLIDKHIVRETAGAYAFAHQYYREYAYDRIDVPTRERRHARIARALEELYPARQVELAPELARHYEAARDDERAVAALLASARGALDVYAREDAYGYASRALAFRPDAATELAVLLVREEALRRMGRRTEQRADLERAQKLADESENGDARREVLDRRVAVAHALADRESERADLVAFAAATAGAEPSWHARLALARGRHALALSRYRETGAYFEEAVNAFVALGDARGAFQTYLLLATLGRVAGDVEGVERCFEAAERQLEAIGDATFFISLLYEERAGYALFRERFVEADGWAQKLLESAEASGDLERRACGHRLIASAAARLFNAPRAREHFSKSIEIFSLLGDRHNAYAALAGSGILAVTLGHLDEAAGAFTKAKQLASALEYPFGVASCAVNLALVEFWRGSAAASAAFAREAVELATELEAHSVLVTALSNLGAAQRELSDLPASIATLEHASDLALARRAEQAPDIFAELALSRARAGDVAGALEAAAGASAGKRDASDASPYRHWCLAEALRLAGAKAEADEAVRAGMSCFQRRLEAIVDQSSRDAFAALEHHRKLRAAQDRLASCECVELART